MVQGARLPSQRGPEDVADAGDMPTRNDAGRRKPICPWAERATGCLVPASLMAPRQGGQGPHALFAPPLRGPWFYLDEARTHEVHAHVVEGGPGFRFVAREWPFGSRGRGEPFESAAPFHEAWEVKYHVADLEARLASLGRYWRHEPPRAGWTPVHRNPATPSVDLRGLDLGGAIPGATFHPFRGPAGRDRLLVSLPTASAGAFALADLDYAFPRVEEGALRLLHPGLPPALLRSLLAREHLALAQRGFGKLATPTDFALAYGPAWRERVVKTFEAVAERVARGPDPSPRPAPAASAPERERPRTDYATALADPRLRAVHARFLKPGEEEALVAGGEPAIRRAVAAKRRTAAHVDQHRLSALEASLLARHALRTGSTVPPEADRILGRLDLLL